MFYISLVTALLFFKVPLIAQTVAMGNVTLHADPRLSVLVKKPHSADQVTASAITTKRRSATNIVRTEQGISGTNASSPPAPRNTKVVSSSVTGPVKTVAVKPLPGENGHAAGWTPPVHRKAHAVYSGKGFRVQIYNGPDRNKAIMIKTEFMRMYPGIRTYLTYLSPSFRVKVGDYRNRSDALGMLKEANSVYNPSMIVPDIITISTF